MTLRRAGTGKLCDDDGWHTTVTCERGHVRKIHRHCYRPDCPRCNRSLALKNARRIASRIVGASNLFGYKARHVSISPPPGLMVEFGASLSLMRETFRTVALACGLHGGALVVHGWREHNRGTGDWYWSPHAHVIGWGYLRRENVPGGWVVRVLRKLEASGPFTEREIIERCVAYELDHAAYVPRRAMHTWYGSASYNRMVTRYSSVWEQSRCEVCNAPEVKHVKADNGERVLIAYMVKSWYAVCERREVRRKRRKRGKRRTFGCLKS